MTVYVLDASVAAKWFTAEEYADTADLLLQGSVVLWAPDLLTLEMDSLTCKWVHHGRIDPAQGRQIRSVLADCGVHYCPSDVLRDVAWDIANATQRAFYDSLYVALALLLDSKVVTADRKLYASLSESPFAEFVLWIGDLQVR